MEITTRALWTMIHGMGFGMLYLLACSGALVELYLWSTPAQRATSIGQQRFLKTYLLVMVALAWLAVLSGTYIVYPWYRATPPLGTTILTAYPQRLLLASRLTSGWHSLGMEWKEHVAWFTPITISMAAYVFLRYGRDLKHHPRLRSAVLWFTLGSFFSAGIAGFFGAMINKYAAVQGSAMLHIEGNK
jgi:hypothetical protein